MIRTFGEWAQISIRTFLRLGVVALILQGCAGEPVKNRYYYNPAWTADGKIMAVREEHISVRGSLSGSGQDIRTHWVIMDADGANERELMPLQAEGFRRSNASPSGNYVVSTGGTDGNLIIWSYPNFIKLNEIPIPTTADRIVFFDWSPDEHNLVVVYGGSSGIEVVIFSRLGIRVNVLKNLTSVDAWKYNDNLYGRIGMFPDLTFRQVAINDDILREYTSAGGDVEQYFPDGQCYLSLTGEGKYRVIDFSVVERYPSLNPAIKSEGESNRLTKNPINPANPTQVMYTGPVYHTFSNAATGEGIWLVNLDGSGNKRIR
ncbi:WD40 repeat domain-containing protein [bacterium]|nr:WD40 repeat domain-containing protein [bacterium]